MYTWQRVVTGPLVLLLVASLPHHSFRLPQKQKPASTDLQPTAVVPEAGSPGDRAQVP